MKIHHIILGNRFNVYILTISFLNQIFGLFLINFLTNNKISIQISIAFSGVVFSYLILYLKLFKIYKLLSLQLLQLIQYLQCITLTIISFNALQKSFNVKSFNDEYMDTIYFYFLILFTVYFSFISILNSVLIENQCDEKSTNFIKKSLAFLLMFRYFYFISRLMGILLFLSTYDDDYFYELQREITLKQISNQFIKLLLILLFYLVLSYIIYFCWYCIKFKCNSKSIFEISFESLKMLVDFNHKYFESYSKIYLIIFMIVQYTIQMIFSYFWFYRALKIHAINQAKTNLYSIFTRLHNRMALINLYELEAKIKLRQLELIIIVGSFIVTMLSYYIYYTYYYNKSSLKNNITFNERLTCIQDRTIFQTSINTKAQTITSYLDQFDESSKSSSDFSLFSGSSSSSSFNVFRNMDSISFDDQFYTAKIHKYTTSEYSTSFSTDSPEIVLKFNSTNRSYLCKKGKNNVYTKSQIFSNDSSIIMRNFEEVSSGIISKASSTSSIYNNLNYLKNLDSSSSIWKSQSLLNAKSLFTCQNLNLHDQYINNTINTSFNHKVLVWFDRNRESS